MTLYFIIENIFTKKFQGSDGFTGESYQIFEKEFISTLHMFF